MMPIMNFVGNFGYVVVCVVGAQLALTGKTPGDIVALSSTFATLRNPCTSWATSRTMQSMAAATERVFEFLAGARRNGKQRPTARTEKRRARRRGV